MSAKIGIGIPEEGHINVRGGPIPYIGVDAEDQFVNELNPTVASMNLARSIEDLRQLQAQRKGLQIQLDELDKKQIEPTMKHIERLRRRLSELVNE